MHTYNFGHFFEDNDLLTLPNIGTLELIKHMPRYDVASKTFEAANSHLFFTQNLNQKVDDSWFTLNNYLDVPDPKMEKEIMLEEITKGKGLNLIGQGTLVKMPYEGFDFIPEKQLESINPNLPCEIVITSDRTHTINAGDNKYTNVEMQEILNTPKPKKSRFWLWAIIIMLLTTLIGVGLYLNKYHFKLF